MVSYLHSNWIRVNIIFVLIFFKKVPPIFHVKMYRIDKIDHPLQILHAKKKEQNSIKSSRK